MSRLATGRGVQPGRCRESAHPPHDSCFLTAVTQRDFFAYCTSLRLIELKALGKLSQVRHFQEGDRIYSPGDEGEELFVINRGVAEVAPEKTAASAPATLLSRGDIFGEMGALMHLPRDHSAKAGADLSVQCFRRSDFSELLRRVPSFFLFLSEKLATRLYQTTELVRSHSAALELTGSLANFDVITIYQTILHSKQTGLLTISDDEGAKISEFYFEKGTPRWGRFGHLIGEEAFWQLFLHDYQAASFSFANGAANREKGVKGGTLSRQADEILINAIHMRDEFDDLRERLRDSSARLRRKQAKLLWDESAPADLRSVAEAIWQLADIEPVALSDLSRECKFCDLKIYKAVDEMVRTGLLVLEDPLSEPCLAVT